MTDDLGPSEEPTEEAKRAAEAPPETVSGADDLPADVRDGTVEEDE